MHKIIKPLAYFYSVFGTLGAICTGITLGKIPVITSRNEITYQANFMVGFILFLTLELSVVTLVAVLFSISHIIENTDTLVYRSQTPDRPSILKPDPFQSSGQISQTTQSTSTNGQFSAYSAPVDTDVSSAPEGSWVCKKCGTTNSPNALYCKDCGTYK